MDLKKKLQQNAKAREAFKRGTSKTSASLKMEEKIEESSASKIKQPKAKKASVSGSSSESSFGVSRKRSRPGLDDIPPWAEDEDDFDPDSESSDDEDSEQTAIAPENKVGYNKQLPKKGRVVELSTEDDDEDFTPEIKPKKQSTDLVVMPPNQVASVPDKPLPKVRSLSKDENLSEEQKDNLVTIFGQRSDTIIDLLEDERNDSATAAILRTLIQTVVDVLPVIEQSVRKSSGTKGVYQFNQTISQLRELCNDMQASQARTGLGLQMVENYIRPAFMDLGIQTSLAFNNLEGAIRAKFPGEQSESIVSEVLRPLVFSLSDYMSRKYEEVKVEIIRGLN